MQPTFSALADVSGLGLNVTKVIRYQCGQYYVLFNATKIIIHKTVNISSVPSYPFLKQTRLLQLLAMKYRQDIQSKAKKKLLTIYRIVWVLALAALYFFPMIFLPSFKKLPLKIKQAIHRNCGYQICNESVLTAVAFFLFSSQATP